MHKVRSALLAAVIASLAAAQDPAAGGMARVRSIEQEYTQLHEKLVRDYAALTALPASDREAAGERLDVAFQEAASDCVVRLLDLAAAGDADVSIAALGAGLGMNASRAQRGKMLKLMGERHATGAIQGLLPRLRYQSGAAVDELLRRVLAENPAAEAKGTACFVLAQRASADDAADQAAAERLFERCAAEWPDVVVGAEKLSVLAPRALFALRNLKIGGTPPDIVGTDMDGKPMKLSDHQGKVVVLDFWGYW